MHIHIIGAGVIGLTTAYYLCEKGHKVTIIEQESNVALGASFAKEIICRLDLKERGQKNPTHETQWKHRRPCRALHSGPQEKLRKTTKNNQAGHTRNKLPMSAACCSTDFK